MKNIKTFLILLLVFIGAFYLRVMNLPNNVLTFGYDQARDAIISQQILSGDIKIQGPPSSAPGLFHGVFYYYVLAVGYFFGGNPINAAYWISFLNSLTIFVVYWIGCKLTKKQSVGLIAAFLFAISFEATQYATWLSNPTLGILTVPLIYLGLWMWISSKNKFAPIITALGLGFSTQSEIFLGYHLVPIIIWLYVERKNISLKSLLSGLGVLFITLFTLVLCEFKFGFTGIDAVKLLISGGNTNLAYAKSLGDFLTLYLNQIGKVFAFNSLPSNIGYGGGLVLGLIIYMISKRDKVGLFLSTWLLSHLSVVSVGGVSTPFLMVGIGPAVSLIIAYWLSNLNKYFVILALAVLLLSNLSLILKENKNGSTLFSIQNGMTLNKQLEVIDFTYVESDGQKYSVNSLTSPLWINIVWTYLYKWYGAEKYGYIPSFAGKDQVGQLDSLPVSEEFVKNSYLIIEPMGGIPVRYLDETLMDENTRSKFVKEKSWGELRVQKRENYVSKK